MTQRRTGKNTKGGRQTKSQKAAEEAKAAKEAEDEQEAESEIAEKAEPNVEKEEEEVKVDPPVINTAAEKTPMTKTTPGTAENAAGAHEESEKESVLNKRKVI